MTQLTWDKVGERTYETGVDHGVLYLADNSGIAWSGLLSVDEDFGDDGDSPMYFDGVKYLDNPSFGDFAATLSALTYPDEFMEYEGIADLGQGLSVDDQNLKTFGLSYRSMVGNDVDGTDHGYKLHVLYNLTAAPSSDSHESLSDSPNPLEFSWGLTSVPQAVAGYRPTAHIIFDSTKLDPVLLSSVEDILYGSPTSGARLPSIDELITLAVAA